MNTSFTASTTDNSLSAVINRALTTAFSVAVVGTVGLMTTVNYLATLSI